MAPLPIRTDVGLPCMFFVLSTTVKYMALFGKTCATTQKNVKSHVFLDFEKNVKKRKKTYI